MRWLIITLALLLASCTHKDLSYDTANEEYKKLIERGLVDTLDDDRFE